MKRASQDLPHRRIIKSEFHKLPLKAFSLKQLKLCTLLVAIALFMPFLISAQGVSDALRYSQTLVQGTARSGAMGNAFGALGGDFTSVSINPAGLGVYRSSEFIFSTVSQHTRIESSYYGNTVDETDYRFRLKNMSYVSTIPTYKSNEAGLVSVNLGIGYNRIADFNSDALAVGINVNGSYMDNIASYANAGEWSEYYEALAWETYVLNYDDSKDEYWTEIGDAGYGQNQSRYLSTNGRINEYSFALGLNFSHKLYLGISYGLNNLYYTETWQMTEADAEGNIPYFRDYTFTDWMETNGWGHNFKFGAIYKPINEVRLGISVHTPTYYKLDDEHHTHMRSAIEDESGDITNYEEPSPWNYYEYRFKTPMRTNFSGAFILAKKGLLSIDYELINYGKSEFSEGDFYQENADIEEIYKSSGNLRVGGEYKLNNAFSLRGGYELQLSAYNDYALGTEQNNSDSNLKVYSTGIGYRNGGFFTDITYRYSVKRDYILPYATPIEGRFSYPDPQFIEQKSVRNDVLWSVGFRF